MPPHWFVPVGRSDPNKRRDEVKNELGNKGKLHSFWEGNDGHLYALVKDCPGLDDDEDLKKRLRVTGSLLGLDREV